MNKTKKKLTVRFFSIKANDSFFDDFISIHHVNQANEKNARIINVRGKKHLIKIHSELQHNEKSVFMLSVVRERNTWQTRALGNGKISGIPLNQGIIGDPYYFLLVPDDKIIIGFTTGLSGSLKSVANATLQQFNKDRTSTVALDFISRDTEFSKFEELNNFSLLYFKVTPTSLGSTNIATPRFLSELSATPFMAGNSQIAFTLTDIGEDGLSESDLVDIVNYLAENDGCSALMVQGLDENENKVRLNFRKAYALFQTIIEVRSKYVEEIKAKEVLFSAITYFEKAN